MTEIDCSVQWCYRCKEFYRSNLSKSPISVFSILCRKYFLENSSDYWVWPFKVCLKVSLIFRNIQIYLILLNFSYISCIFNYSIQPPTKQNSDCATADSRTYSCYIFLFVLLPTFHAIRRRLGPSLLLASLSSSLFFSICVTQLSPMNYNSTWILK